MSSASSEEPSQTSVGQPSPLSDSPATVENSANAQARSRLMTLSAEMYSGPIPPPAIMAEWETILPASADRILKMAEKQSAHRISLEAKVIDGDNYRANSGLWIACFIGITMIIGGLLVIALGHDWAGVAVLATTLVGVVSVFIFG